MDNAETCLVADIGGTKARLALVEPPRDSTGERAIHELERCVELPAGQDLWDPWFCGDLKLGHEVLLPVGSPGRDRSAPCSCRVASSSSSRS